MTKAGGKNLWNLFNPSYPGKGEKGAKTMFFPSFSPDGGDKPKFNLFKPSIRWHNATIAYLNFSY